MVVVFLCPFCIRHALLHECCHLKSSFINVRLMMCNVCISIGRRAFNLYLFRVCFRSFFLSLCAFFQWAIYICLLTDLFIWFVLIVNFIYIHRLCLLSQQIQYKLIDLTDCGLDDASATALFDIIEYYEAANEIDISENRNITNRGWQACINMVKRSHALQILVTRGTPLSESNAISLGKSMLASSLNTLKLEHCGLSGRPMASLCKIFTIVDS